MPAPTKIWTVPVATRQDPAVPITTSWGNDTWDNLEFLMEWLGNDYLANAAQNHNHDGVNSAKISFLEGLMPNGSFEEVSAGMPMGFTATPFTGGTVASSSAVNKHGAKVLAITSTVLANGGGSALQDAYTAVTDNVRYGIEFYYWANVLNVSGKVELVWYNAAKAQISVTSLMSSSALPTAPTVWSGTNFSPANARFCRFKFTGGVPASGSAVGTVYFDAGRLVNALPARLVTQIAMAADSVGTVQIQGNSVNANQIAANAVHTSELYTLSASASIYKPFTNLQTYITDIVMTGGLTVFLPQVRVSTGSGYLYGTENNVTTYSTTFETLMRIGFNGPSPGTEYCQWSYVSASPPHDMGDGDIPLFVYALIDKSGAIRAISHAQEPVWLHNGPTRAVPDIKHDGKSFLLIKKGTEKYANLPFNERAAAIAGLETIEVPLTNEIIHADMNIIPHPFSNHNLGDVTPVLLDPVSQCVRDLYILRNDGEDIDDILYSGHIKIGNTGLKRVTPKGLLIPETYWTKK